MPKKNGKESSKSGPLTALLKRIFGRSREKVEDNLPLGAISPKTTIPLSDEVITALPNGLFVKSDGKPLIMGDMKVQTDKRNQLSGLGLGRTSTGTQQYLGPSLQQAAFGIEQQSALLAQQKQFPWVGLGQMASAGLYPDVPKKEFEIPMQQPTGKRKIKLVD